MLPATKVFLIVTIVLGAATVGIEISAAQESPTPEPSGTAAPTATPEPDTTVQVISPTTRVVEMEYRDGAFHLVIEADTPALLTAVEGVDVGSAEGTSSGSISFKRQSLAQGKNEVVVDAPLDRGRALVVLTVRGEAAYVSYNTGGGFLSGPPRSADLRDASVGASIGTALAALIVIIRRRFGLHRGMVRQA